MFDGDCRDGCMQNYGGEKWLRYIGSVGGDRRYGFPRVGGGNREVKTG